MRGIYLIVHKPSKTVYYGQSCNVEQRFYQHKYSLRSGRHENPKLQNAWNKYKEEDFIFECCYGTLNEDLAILENNFIVRAKKVGLKIFNIKDPENPYIWSVESKKKNSLSHKNIIKSKEWCRKLAKAATGKKFSEETKKKMSLAKLGNSNAYKSKY